MGWDRPRRPINVFGSHHFEDGDRVISSNGFVARHYGGNPQRVLLTRWRLVRQLYYQELMLESRPGRWIVAIYFKPAQWYHCDAVARSLQGAQE